MTTQEFKAWAKSREIEVTNESGDLKAGQVVIYTNDYGVKFRRSILGFRCDPDNGRSVYLDKDSYWFPVLPGSLTIEN